MKVSAIQNNSFYQTKQVKNSRKRQNQMMQTAQPAFKSEKGVLIGAVSGFAVGTLANVLLNSPLIIAGGAVAGIIGAFIGNKITEKDDKKSDNEQDK